MIKNICSTLFFSQRAKIRFAFSLFANILRASFGFLTTLLLARLMGPANYGQFVFLWGFFLALSSLSDLGSRRAFFYFVSHKQQPAKHYLFFFIWVLIQTSIPALVIVYFLPQDIIGFVWVGVSKQLIVLSLFAVFLRDYIWLIVTYAYEGARKTQQIQSASLIITAINLAVIVVLYKVGMLTIVAVFVSIIVEYVLALLVAGVVINRWSFVNDTIKFNFKDTFLKYREYCAPLLLLGFVIFIYGIADRWLLQHYAGSVDSAYYGVANYIISGSMIFTSSMVNVFWKEMGAAKSSDDYVKINLIYTKATKLLFMLQMFICAYICCWSHEIFSIFLGNKYSGGYLAMAIIILYSPFQTLDILLQAVYFSLGNTKSLSVIMGIFRILSIPITYVLVANKDAFIPGLGLGATGIGIKLLVLNILYFNIGAWYLSKKEKITYTWSYQVFGFIFMIGTGVAIKIIMSSISLNDIIKLAVSLFLYCFVNGIVLLYNPKQFGVEQEISKLFGFIKNRFKEWPCKN